MTEVTINVSDDAAKMIEYMMKQYAKQSGKPAPTLQAAVASFFVMGFRDSVTYRENEPEGFKFGEWIPRDIVERMENDQEEGGAQQGESQEDA